VTPRHSDEQRPADVEIGAAVRARRLRFRRKPETRVEFTAESAGELDLPIEAETRSERKNLPEEVEPGKVYRDVEVGWAARARIDDSEVERLEEKIEERRRKA
jgi:hypothetical protein